MRIAETEAELQVRVTAALDVAQIHRDRIVAAMEYLSTRFPQTSQELVDADYTVIASVELLTSRFGKLQDHLGVQLVPLALDLSEEPLPVTATFLDKLFLLEKLRVLPSVAEFRHLRALRNELAHDYPDDPDQALAALAQVVAAVPLLLALEAGFRRHLTDMLKRADSQN